MLVEIVWVNLLQYPKSSSCNEKTSWLLYIKLINLAWFSLCKGTSPKLSLKGRCSTSFWKLKSATSVLGQGPNVGQGSVDGFVSG